MHSFKFPPCTYSLLSRIWGTFIYNHVLSTSNPGLTVFCWYRKVYSLYDDLQTFHLFFASASDNCWTLVTMSTLFRRDLWILVVLIFLEHPVKINTTCSDLSVIHYRGSMVWQFWPKTCGMAQQSEHSTVAEVHSSKTNNKIDTSFIDSNALWGKVYNVMVIQPESLGITTTAKSLENIL